MARNLPQTVTATWIAESKSIADDLLRLEAKCQRLKAKTDANGLYAEDAPDGQDDVAITAVREAYINIVLQLVKFVNNEVVDRSDRAGIAWRLIRANSV
jgi:hypothetical protein